MRKNYFFFKSLLLATVLLLGSANAWAGDVYTIVYGTPVYDTDGVTVIGVNPQTDFTSSDGSTASGITHTDANGSKCDEAMPVGGSVLYSNPTFTHNFATPATKGIVHFEANYTATTNGQETWQILDSKGVEIFGSTDAGYSNGNAAKIWGFCNGESLGTNWFRQARGGHNRVVLDINFSTKKVAYTVLVSSGSNSYSTLTGSYDLPEGVSDVAGLKGTKQSYYSYMDYVSLYNVYDDAVTLYDYTINYTYGGSIIETAVGQDELDAVVNAETPITINEVKYYAKDGEETSMTITDGTNVLDVDLRLAENWNYTVKAIDGGNNVLKTLLVGDVLEGETASYGYPQYIAIDGTLYQSTKQGSNPWWGKSFTPVANNEEQTITYTAQSTTGVVFCEEAEDIPTLNEVSGGNTDIRASNRKGAYGGADVASGCYITTLPAGIYKIHGATYGNAGTDLSVYAGETVVFSITTSGNPVHTDGNDFTLTESTDLVLVGGNGGNSPKILDYIYITLSGVPAKITPAGWATFSSSYALDLSNMTADHDVTAFYASEVSGGNVTLTEIEEDNIAAGTGIMLKGTAGDVVTIPVAATGEEIAGNILVGCPTDDTVPANKYVFAYKNGLESTTAAFYPVETATAISAGKAYLDYTSLAKKISFVINGEATNVDAIEVAEAEEEEVLYNMAGVQVDKNFKGFVINQKGEKRFNK